MTEFTSSHGVRASMGARKPTKNSPSATWRLRPEEHPISAQLFGSDPAVMADAARFVRTSARHPGYQLWVPGQ